MAYVALYRQWRPQDFDSLVGQEHISVTLKNAVSSEKIAHAYLFTGSRGTGKTSTAKILAKALNCQNGPTPKPCNNCSICGQINTGSSMDVFEIDAASNRGIDEIRDLRETIKFAPAECRYKVYIIDEVHMLTTEAFNALLKTLEEPPAHVVFILATTEPHKIPATIHSRCQRYDFRRIGTRQIEQQLCLVAEKTGIEITAEALRLIAVKADGAMRDALSILDQCIAFGQRIDASLVRKLLGMIGQELICSVVDAILAKDACAVLAKIDHLVNHGKDVRQLLLELTLHMRALMLYKAAPSLENIELYSENKDVLDRQSSLLSHNEIVKILDVLHEAANDAKWAQEPRIQAEMALISICRRAGESDLTALAARLAALENKIATSTVPDEALIPSAKLAHQKAQQPNPPLKTPANRPPDTSFEKPLSQTPAKADAKGVGGNPVLSAGSSLHSADKQMRSVDTPMHSADNPMHSADTPMHSADNPMHSADKQIHSADTPMYSADTPMHSADTPMHSADTPMHSADNPMHSADNPMHSADNPMHSADKQMRSSDNLIPSVGNPPLSADNPVQPGVTVSQYSGAELAQIWDDVLKSALASNKRPFHACITQGKLVKMTDSLAEVEFAVSFPKERTEKEDFRSMVENLLAQITGKERRLVCVLSGGKIGASAVKRGLVEKIGHKNVPVAPLEIQKSEQEHPALVKAREIFGGTIERITKN